MANRLAANPATAHKYAGTVNERGQWTGKINVSVETLDEPYEWRKPRMVFVNSMSDMFHEVVDERFLNTMFCRMHAVDWHKYLVLTKRPERMLRYIETREPSTTNGYSIQLRDIRGGLNDIERWPIPNVWLGFSAEDQETFDERWEPMRELARAGWNTFVSLEPLLGPVALPGDAKESLGWVIVGGESGPGARPPHPDWARSIRDQCRRLNIPFFFKQWGAWAPRSQVAVTLEHVKKPHVAICVHGRTSEFSQEAMKAACPICHHRWEWLCRTGKKFAGNTLDGSQHQQWPFDSN